MFKNLRETIASLNRDVNNVVNSEKAKALKKKLLKIGLPMVIGGFLGVFVCSILLVTAGHSAFGDNGFTARIIIPFVLIIPCALCGMIGLVISSYGFKIIIVDVATNLVGEVVSNDCPNCKESLPVGAVFCIKCGTKIKNVCPNCAYENDKDNTFCAKCGTKL